MTSVNSSAAPKPHPLIVCTAGHIDHGKSRLIQALTGVDPDRLPEERARGMTIDLGFAHARVDDADLWFVDVPGHERFIRNMVAGAGGVDLAMLVVAADDSVMPQTREHAELLSLLGIQRCLLVLTKIDLVDADWAAAVEEEARTLLQTLRIETRACIHVSTVSGAGLDALRDALRDAARSESDRDHSPRGWFRLAIDRAFIIAGRGAVVTGSIAHGTTHANEELELWPPGKSVRVRGLHADRQARETADGRMRIGLNLAGVALDELSRGQQLATPGYLAAAKRLDVRLEWLRMPGRTTRRSIAVRLLIGTREAMARVRLPVTPEPGAFSGFAQIETEEPIIAAHGDRFALRNVSATRTLGGGTVLRPIAQRWSRRHPFDPELLSALENERPRARLLAALTAQGWPEATPAQLAARAALHDAAETDKLLRELSNAGQIVRLIPNPSHAVAPAALLRKTVDAILERMNARLRDNPRWPGVPRREWPNWMPRVCPAAWRDGLAQQLLTHDRRLTERGGCIIPADQAAQQLPAEDESLYQAILEEFRSGALRPPDESTLACRTPRNAKRVSELIALGEARGALRRFAPGMWLHAEAWEHARDSVCSLLRVRGAATLSEIREHLGTTRKYMVPLAEHLDAQGITRRRGDQRTLACDAPRPDESESSS